MSRTEMARDVLTLSGSTLSRLFSSDRYDVIDACLAHWVQWILDQGDKSWPTWHDCWADYKGAK